MSAKRMDSVTLKVSAHSSVMNRRSASRRQLSPAMAASHSRSWHAAHWRTRSLCDSNSPQQRKMCGSSASE
eukprot:1808542-Pyramimonas_sp.AAC.1